MIAFVDERGKVEAVYAPLLAVKILKYRRDAIAATVVPGLGLFLHRGIVFPQLLYLCMELSPYEVLVGDAGLFNFSPRSGTKQRSIVRKTKLHRPLLLCGTREWRV